MRFNGTRVSLYRDKLGPYDGYCKGGCLYSTLGKHQTVSYAFDYDGQHIGVIRRKLYAKAWICCLMIALLVSVGTYTAVTYDGTEGTVVLYMPIEPTAVNGDTLQLEITNLMEESTYITVGNDVFEILPGDTLKSVPLISYVSEIVITYKDKSVTREIVYD